MHYWIDTSIFWQIKTKYGSLGWKIFCLINIDPDWCGWIMPIKWKLNEITSTNTYLINSADQTPEKRLIDTHHGWQMHNGKIKKWINGRIIQTIRISNWKWMQEMSVFLVENGLFHFQICILFFQCSWLIQVNVNEKQKPD